MDPADLRAKGVLSNRRYMPNREESPDSHSAQVAEHAVDEGIATELAGLFKALGDPVRLRLLSLIDSQPHGEACVCDLVGAFDLTQPTISHHLKVLREAGLVRGDRRGTWVYYRVEPQAFDRVSLTDLLRPAVAA